MVGVSCPAKRSEKPTDPAGLLVVDCPQCGRQQGAWEPGLFHCTCGAWLDVTPFDGWQPAAKPQPLPQNEVAPETLEKLQADQ